jgi:hypothetical protein
VSSVTVKSAIEGAADRPVAAGKPKKVALAARMRKLLTIPGAVFRDRAPWGRRVPAQKGADALRGRERAQKE